MIDLKQCCTEYRRLVYDITVLIRKHTANSDRCEAALFFYAEKKQIQIKTLNIQNNKTEGYNP